jgi:O-antigen/teichoic acid export membrane protein
VGLFSVGLTISNLAVQGPMLFTGGLLPYFSESFGRNAVDDIRSGYATATRIIGFLVFPACFGLAGIMPSILPLIYGQDFAEVVPAATVLVVASSITAVASVGTNLLYGLDRSDFIFVSGAVGAVLSVVAGLTLIPMFGVFGASCGRAAIQVAVAVFAAWFIMHRLRCPIPAKDLLRLMIAAAVCGVAARGCSAVISGVVAIPLSILIGAIVYLATVRLLRALPRNDVNRLQWLGQRLPKPLRSFSAKGLRLIFGL